MPAGDASLTTAQVKKNPLTAITVSTATASPNEKSPNCFQILLGFRLDGRLIAGDVSVPTRSR